MVCKFVTLHLKWDSSHQSFLQRYFLLKKLTVCKGWRSSCRSPWQILSSLQWVSFWWIILIFSYPISVFNLKNVRSDWKWADNSSDFKDLGEIGNCKATKSNLQQFCFIMTVELDKHCNWSASSIDKTSWKRIEKRPKSIRAVYIPHLE